MSEFFIKDGHDTLNDLTDVRNLVETFPDTQHTLEYAKALRQMHWDSRRTTSDGSRFGGDYQWLAHIPGRVAAAMEAREPDIFIDEQKFTKWLQEHPEFSALPTEEKL